MQFLQLLTTTHRVPVGRLQEEGVDFRCRRAQTVQCLLYFSRRWTKTRILLQHGQQETFKRRRDSGVDSRWWNRVLGENSIRRAEGRTAGVERVHSGGRFVEHNAER